MSQGPETRFTQGVNRHLSSAVHREKMHNPYRGGTPDWYYEGKANILWAEYKFLITVPPTIRLMDSSKYVTDLQALWLTRAYKNNKPVCVITGWEKGAVIFEGVTWMNEITREDFERKTISKQEAAEWIQESVLRKSKK